MDAIDNLIFATISSGKQSDDLQNPFVNFVPESTVIATDLGNVDLYRYGNDDRFTYSSFLDAAIIERGINRAYFDLDDATPYDHGGINLNTPFGTVQPIHIIYAYLLENTRIVQIIERLIDKYFNDEELGIIGTNNQDAFQWLVNTERLFFGTNGRHLRLRSSLRPDYEATRRNAYHRLLGLDLAFGSPNSGDPNYLYRKAKASNQSFVPLFEQYLSEVWQAYINSRNSSGPNTTDVQNLVDLAARLRQMLVSRRGLNPIYQYQNLAYEEFSSVLFLNWLSSAFSYESPLAQFLACDANNFGDSLIRLGVKVGLPAHNKSQALFDLASPAALILRTVENGAELESTEWVSEMIRIGGAVQTSALQPYYMTQFLSVINNWEKATGHKIKNRESNITGTVRVAQLARGATLVTN